MALCQDAGVVVDAIICINPRAEKKLSSAGAASSRSRKAKPLSSGPNFLGYVHFVGAAAGTSDRVEEGYIYIPRNEG